MIGPTQAEKFPPPPDDLSFDQVKLSFVRIIPGDVSQGLVPAYHFRILANGVDAGHINFRVGDTEHVRISAGHIGFQVIESCRGHGYAFQACRAVAPFVRVFYNDVILTCDPGNTASIRTIERLKADFIDMVPVPPHDPQFQAGARAKRRYRWTL